MTDFTESNTQSEQSLYTQSEQRNCDDNKIAEWSDERCFEIAMEEMFPACVKDLNTQKSIINRFLNFYLSGKVQKGLSVSDIVFAVISIMPFSLSSEVLIWSGIHYNDNGNLFFLTPEDKLKKEIKSVIERQNKKIVVCNEKDELINNDQNGIEPQSEVVEKSDKELSSTNEVNQDKKIVDCGRTETHEQGNDATDKTDEETHESDEGNKGDEINKMNHTDNKSLDTLKWFRKKKSSHQSKTENYEYGPAENAAFCISCNKLLNQWDSDATARIYLKCFFGFAALVLMRTITKSYQNVIYVFRNNFTKMVAFSSNHINYSIPDETCIKKSFKMFRKLERKTRIMFAKIVFNSFSMNYRMNENPELRTPGISNVFDYAILSPTADYGLDIISMLQTIASNTYFFSIAFESLKSEETAASWDRVNNFLNKYMAKSSLQLTFHWARIIEREQFKYLSCDKNYELAVVIAVFVEKLSESNGIWKARWLKTGSNLEEYKQLGLKMYQDFENTPNGYELQLQFLKAYILT